MYKYPFGIDELDTKTGGINPGTNILILAPAFSAGDLLASYLAHPRDGEYMLVLSTESQADELEGSFKAGKYNLDHIGIIDAVSKSSSGSIADEKQRKYVGSPNDLTGMDIKFSQLTEEIMKGEFTDDPDQLFPTPIRYCILSLTTLLMFRKVDVIYQFLHVISSKLKKMGSVGIYLLNGESFDEKTVAVIKQLMNIVFEVRNDDDGNSFRVRGTMGLSLNWRQFTIEEGVLTLK
ncbi:MAG: hypothetical protein JXA44_01945 [Methanospirillaceae archaeon]|nr:hypothetical protein [Methanospirillaceae archaeon]